jgi:hypothetical protein
VITTLKTLKYLYPYMFDGPNIGIGVPNGWLPIFEKLCEDIDIALGADKRGFHFSQCKEKFGAARWYWRIDGGSSGIRLNVISQAGDIASYPLGKANPPNSMSSRLAAMVDAASEQTRHHCMACGASASISRDQGWMVTLCDLHTRQMNDGVHLNIWDEESE